MWGVRPSELLDLTDDPYVAYCVDQAIGYWGSAIDAALDEVEEEDLQRAKAKRRQVLHQYLNPEAQDKPVKGQYADPAMFM